MAMSSPTTGRNGGKNLTCRECQQTFRSPRILPCFHTFCLYCLEALARTHGQSFPCPECRQPTAVPPQGAVGFHVNVYITEEELERESQGTAVCATHPTEPLVLFCVKCVLAICIRCKLTKHNEHGDAEDLSAAAARSAGYLKTRLDRLEGTITLLTNSAALTQDSLRQTRLKAKVLKQQVQTQRDLLFQRIDATCASVLRELDTSSSAVEGRLTMTVQSTQQQLDSLVQLRQRVRHALTSQASDVDTVQMEKEMRQGKGSEESLRGMEKNVPASTLRQVVHFDNDRISEDDIYHVLGRPVTLSMPAKAPSEVIVPVYKYTGGARLSKEVSGLCQKDSEKYIVVVWDRLAGKCIRIVIDEEGRHYCQKVTERESCKRYRERWYFNSTVEYREGEKKALRLNSKSYHPQLFRVHHIPQEGTWVVKLQVLSSQPLQIVSHFIQETNLAEPAAFDATAEGDVFALVEIPPGQQSLEADEAGRQVCLYHRDHNRPFARYTPQDTNFYPSDVCFWRVNNQDKLLVADRQNDCVHVVSLHDDEVHLQHYLAAGDSNIVRPTALNTDDQGRIWIGCENGQVLRCETRTLESNGSQEADEEANADIDSGTADLSEIAMTVSDSSARSLLLRVENSSQSTSISRQVSEDT